MAELLAKTSAAVAVDDTLTVLIDWVNIESVSGFTIVVENAGGGSANDIDDIQIDISNDGGITPTLDQHPGVPAVPIASGKASVGTFTQTAFYIRIRAKCAADEDTTATALLTADSAVGRLCTLADVKSRLSISGVEHDLLIGRIVSGLAVIFETECERPLLATPIALTEYYTGRGPYLQLRRYPVVSITSIKESLTYDFDGASALIVNYDYRIVNAGTNGILYSVYGAWSDYADSIQIVSKGGYCSAGQTPGEGEFAMPDDLREAAIEQSSFIFKRKDDLGLSAVSFQGGSISKFAPMDLLPMVKQILSNKYRRLPSC